MQLSKKIGRFLPRRIWQQIFVILILLAAVPLIVLGTLLIFTSQKAVKTTVLRDHRELALRAAGQVNEFVQKPRELLQTVASIIGVEHADAWRQETAIVELCLRYPIFRRVAFVDLKGEETAISQLGAAKRNRALELAFRKARDGQTFVSDVQIEGKDTPITTIAVPITRWGKTAGVLIADVNLRGMWDIVDSIHIGKTGYACIVSSQGILLSHPNKKLVMDKQGLANSVITERVLSGENGSREDIDDKGRRWLVSYAPITSTGWRLAVFQAASEAYAFSKIMIVQSWVFVLLSILAAFLISLFLARFMSYPLNMLLEGTRRISQKDFDHPLVVTRNDEIGRIIHSFNAMTRKLKEAQEAEKLSVIGRAATSIAHELKNSLVLVDTYIQMMKEQYKDKKFIQEFADVVPRELKAWKGMLRNMTEYARTPNFSMQELDVNALVDEILLLAKIRVRQHGVTLTVDKEDNLPAVWGNVEKLRQVMLNLLSNALDSTPSQGGIKLTTRVNTDGESLLIAVENNGPQIPPEKISRVFEPFFTTKDGGLGLGLPICREIVQRHGGRIEVTSDPGATVFRIQLPLQKGRHERVL